MTLRHVTGVHFVRLIDVRQRKPTLPLPLRLLLLPPPLPLPL
jgi:hypothetical protein